ncbi:type II secretion system protein GspJ [Aliidiomarina shirensis]|uniref:Type II secretion system protein J n=1 Tax=Aliidiomarina shirensis TaxID=1048642 RepID=A0A432WUH9_9GAMM|nr:type II secretion system minor pseudopilin GspJ [Aliidiomarina shirensis]RUO37423.1 type II secretion system protein GspJ [Aliidiomarina shirensis]
MQKARGFTLIEVMVAMAILAIIGLVSAMVLSQMLDSERVSKARHEQLSELQFAMVTLDRDVRQMVIRQVRALPEEGRNFYISNDADLIDSDSGGLAFVRAGWSNPDMMLPRSELQPVVYRVREGVLQRVYRPFVDDVSGDQIVQDLLTGVESLEVSFQDAGEDHDTWDQPNRFPDLVVVRIELESYGVIERWLLTSGDKPEALP